jgi:hypothetical protein
MICHYPLFLGDNGGQFRPVEKKAKGSQMDSFTALMKGSKRNGSEISFDDMLGGGGGSTRLGPRKRAFQEVDVAIASAIEGEENEAVVEVLEGLRVRVAALELGVPKGGVRGKNGVSKVLHLVCVSKSGNRIYFRDMGEGTMETLQESFASCYGFKAKKEALDYIDTGTGNALKMF